MNAFVNQSRYHSTKDLVFSAPSAPYIFSLWYISYTKHTVKSQEAVKTETEARVASLQRTMANGSNTLAGLQFIDYH